MNTDKTKIEATEEELKTLKSKNFDPKIKASIDEKLKYVNKPIKK